MDLIGFWLDSGWVWLDPEWILFGFGWDLEVVEDVVDISGTDGILAVHMYT